VTFLEALRAARCAPAAIMQRFRMYYNRDRTAFFAFVEGSEDREYLQPAILSRIHGALYFLKCGNKHKVLKAREDIRKDFPDVKRAMFFIDKDFDDQLGIAHPEDNALFVTSYYSIENHLVGNEALHIVLCNIVHLESEDDRVSHLAKKYQDLTHQFSTYLRNFTAITICARRQALSVNLNNVRLSQIFSISNDFELVAVEGYEAELTRMSGLETDVINEADVSQLLTVLNCIDYKIWLRGKFDLWLFVRFVTKIYEELRAEHNFERDFRLQTPITESNIFQLLSGRVSYPASLNSFLEGMSSAV